MPCNKCGECCKVLLFEFPNACDELISFYASARELKTYINGVGTLQVLIPHRCPHLTEDNLCDIHQYLNSTSACARYTGKGLGHIFPNCGYNKNACN